MKQLEIKMTPSQFLNMWDEIREMNDKSASVIADAVYSTLTRYMSIDDMSNLNQYLGAYREFENEVEIIEED